jgi:hypothetical protein
MSFFAERALPAFPSHFTLRLFQAGPERHRVSTAVFYKDQVLRVCFMDPSGRNTDYARPQTFNTVGSWIQSVMAAYDCPLVLEGMSADYYWNIKNKAALENEFRPIPINPVGKAVSSFKTAQPDQKAILARMAELLTQQSVIDQELSDLMAQITV